MIKPKAPQGLGIWYEPPNIPAKAIRQFARQIAERFQPDKIILFGSYAYGRPHAASDVDLLVVMPARNQIDQAVKISLALPSPFPLDLIVRTPKDLAWRLKEGDWFLREVMEQGKVLYEKTDGRVGAKSRTRLHGARNPRAKRLIVRKKPFRYDACDEGGGAEYAKAT
jgi:predicted nucleotidyltransferase